MFDIIDRINGVIFGQAVGDALGLGTEFMSRKKVQAVYPDGLHDYAQVIQDSHRRRWQTGDWTDDTDQMLCILDSILANQAVDQFDVARRILEWANHGGMGIGRTVKAVLYDRNFLVDPHGAARRVWEASGRKVASNGAVMRTAILGVWQYPSEAEVIFNAEAICQVTHYDLRCVGSCVAVCLAIRRLLLGETDLPAIFASVQERCQAYSPEIGKYLELATRHSLDDLKLDEGLNPGEADLIGYTLKALGAGFWAWLHADSFEAGLRPVVEAGGDGDTNAAVAGALLGARFGLAGIPERWISGLRHGEALAERIDRLARLMGLAEAW